MKIEIYDTTLRDGAQGAGINFTNADKLKIIHALDELGVTYIEAWDHTANKTDNMFFNAPIQLKNSKLTAFGSTRKPYEPITEGHVLHTIAESSAQTVTIFGKSWLHHVDAVLKTTPEENLNMIFDTVKYLKSHGKDVIFDAEHFFDGYRDNAEYALMTIETARKAAANAAALCDTNGSMLPDEIKRIFTEVKNKFPALKLGIHCHNDIGTAAANTIAAVTCGAVQVQGTISGIGERCGNANLNTIIPILQIKLKHECISGEQLTLLTSTARYVNEVANRAFDENEPFVGGHAFTHKAGTHIDAVRKSTRAVEHIIPSMVGNERKLLISGLAGSAAIHEKMIKVIPNLTKDSPQVTETLNMIKAYENEGYRYEDAEASLMLLIYGALGIRSETFNLIRYQVSVTEASNETNHCTALIKIAVGDETEITVAEGNGPVHALDMALRKALLRFYPAIEPVKLVDYKVRVLNGEDATASKVRVSIESTDGSKTWRTVGVSEDIIDASWQALADSYEYILI